MRPDAINFGNLGLILLLWAAVIAAIFFAVRGIVGYVRRSRRREAREQEMLELMLRQGGNHGQD